MLSTCGSLMSPYFRKPPSHTPILFSSCLCWATFRSLSSVCLSLNLAVFPNLRSLNPDYKRCSRTLGNKITASLASGATLFQIKLSKLICFTTNTQMDGCTWTPQHSAGWLAGFSDGRVGICVFISNPRLWLQRVPLPIPLLSLRQCSSNLIHFNLWRQPACEVKQLLCFEGVLNSVLKVLLIYSHFNPTVPECCYSVCF